MNPLLVTGIWITLTFGASAFIVVEAINAVRDYLYQRRADGDTADAAKLLAIKAVCLASAMLLFLTVGILSYILPQPLPPPEFKMRSAILQSILLVGQLFIFLDALALFSLRRLAKRRFREEAERRERLELTRDELTEEIRENRRIFGEIGATVLDRLDTINRKLDKW